MDAFLSARHIKEGLTIGICTLRYAYNLLIVIIWFIGNDVTIAGKRLAYINEDI